ncbi:hypothetical protein CNN82_20320 [Pseudomonas frederiksbergensis]|uniref:Uncharacterized protein n=1 Tax=Pseudomonas frederiksbergensis TaxID=104087 RepID=A0AB33EDX1_9PSED|nr:hypothetical protein CNN82_20320 [Pseudomonas frederiksbergensis]
MEFSGWNALQGLKCCTRVAAIAGLKQIFGGYSSQTTLRSSCRAREAAFGCAAVVKSGTAVRQAHCAFRVYDCCAAERRLRQLLRSASQLKNSSVEADYV